MGIGETGVGETGVGEMGMGETGVGETGVGETGTSHFKVFDYFQSLRLPSSEPQVTWDSRYLHIVNVFKVCHIISHFFKMIVFKSLIKAMPR